MSHFFSYALENDRQAQRHDTVVDGLGRAEEGAERSCGTALVPTRPPTVDEGLAHESIPFHSTHPAGGLAGLPAQAGTVLREVP